MRKMSDISDDEVISTLEMFGGNKSAAANHLGVAASTLKDRIRRIKGMGPAKMESHKTEGGEVTDMVTESGDRSIGSLSTRIETLEELVDYCQIDLKKWIVERHIVNKWEVGAKHPKTGRITVEPLFQIKVWLKPVDPVQRGFEDAVEGLCKRIADHAPKYPKTRKTKDSGNMLEISLYDVHVGKLGWGREVGEDYDLEISETRIASALAGLLDRSAHYKFDKIVLPVGQDYFHINSAEMTTERGTPQDVDGRFEKIFETGFNAMINAVDVLQKVAPVELLYVPGNHDRRTSWHLCGVLDAWYRNNNRVMVDKEPTKRKYRTWGPVLLGFTHGDKVKPDNLPGTMAVEVPQLWAETKHREWHTGHLHKRKGTVYTFADTLHTVTVRVLPSISGTDAWHYENGYIGNDKAAEAYVWSKDHGYISHINVDL